MHLEDGKHFGNRLREARIAAGLSQSELEELSGIPKARLSRYENGHVEPSIQTLARLARALNVSEASLLGDQRAVLEDFFTVLYDRGVRIGTTEQSVRLAHAAGVLIAAGTDFGGGSSRANQLAWEVESLVEAGLEPWEALAAATWHGGQVLGEPEAGVIREGGPADFFLVHGDPLSDPSALWRVWRVAW